VGTVVLGLVGLSLLGAGWPLARGFIKPNRWYGYRTRRTLSDSAQWYASNRIAGRDLMLIGAAMSVGVGVIIGIRVLVYPALNLPLCDVVLAVGLAAATLFSTWSIPGRRP
jgi:uncharacterized membrane protein